MNDLELIERYRPPSPGVAAVLSVLLPGLGQVYAGRMLAGAVWFVATGFTGRSCCRASSSTRCASGPPTRARATGRTTDGLDGRARARLRRDQ